MSAEHLVRQLPSAMTAPVGELGIGSAEHDHAIDQIEPYVDMMFDHNHASRPVCLDDLFDRVMHFLDHAFGIEVGGRFVQATADRAS